MHCAPARMTWPTREELRVIQSPNRHASLPCPAKGRVVSLLRELSGELALLGVTSIALFGSVARGDDTLESDVDIAVRVTNANSLMAFTHVAELLEVHCNRHVDVVPLPLPRSLNATAGDDLVIVS